MNSVPFLRGDGVFHVERLVELALPQDAVLGGEEVGLLSLGHHLQGVGNVLNNMKALVKNIFNLFISSLIIVTAVQSIPKKRVTRLLF